MRRVAFIPILLAKEPGRLDSIAPQKEPGGTINTQPPGISSSLKLWNYKESLTVTASRNVHATCEKCFRLWWRKRLSGNSIILLASSRNDSCQGGRLLPLGCPENMMSLA